MESVTRVIPKDDFSLELWFDDGTQIKGVRVNCFGLLH